MRHIQGSKFSTESHLYGKAMYTIKTDIVNHPYFLSPFYMIRISIKAISGNPHSHSYHKTKQRTYIYNMRDVLHREHSFIPAFAKQCEKCIPFATSAIYLTFVRISNMLHNLIHFLAFKALCIYCMFVYVCVYLQIRLKRNK